MTQLDYLKGILSSLESIAFDLQKSRWIDDPVWVPDLQQFRHERLHDCLFLFLKSIRMVSHLNASVVLLENGHVHEMGVLCRCMDETFEDMTMFMKTLGDDGSPSKEQIRILDEFFQEQFKDISDPMLESVERDRVPRKKIRNAIAGLAENPANPHDLSQLKGTLYDTYSGYVHGAYPHIMELYSWPPSQYAMSGMLQRIPDWTRQLGVYVYRGVLAVLLTARRLGEEEATRQLLEIRTDMEGSYPGFAEDPKSALQQLKRKRK